MDAVEYFAACGHGARIKMFHAVRAPVTYSELSRQSFTELSGVVSGDVVDRPCGALLAMQVRADLTGTDCPYELLLVAKVGQLVQLQLAQVPAKNWSCMLQHSPAQFDASSSAAYCQAPTIACTACKSILHGHHPSQEHIYSDYYTMSASGVVHMFRDGSPAEFTPIGDWVREHSVFNMMKQVGGHYTPRTGELCFRGLSCCCVSCQGMSKYICKFLSNLLVKLSLILA